MQDLVDAEAAAAGAAQRASMRAHFLRSCRYEWMFWDAAWRLERWPV
jgi:thiaminase